MTQNNKTVVIKFGGASVGGYKEIGINLPKIKDVILEYKKSYENVVVVVSAMKGETRRLKRMSDDLFAIDNLKMKDKILANGEAFSSKILGDYLNSCDVKTKVLVDNELPIFTDGKFGDSNIIDVDTDSINNHLNNGNIVVIPGYIGKTKDGDISTLGFDGSDITAIVTTGYLKADKCCLLKDVCGVFTANPRRAPKATKIDQISYDNMFILSLLGARIIHPKAVDFAMKNSLVVQIQPSFAKDDGTIISAQDNEDGVIGVTYFEHSDNMITVSMVGNNLKYSVDEIQALLKTHDIETSRLTKELYPRNNVTLELTNKNDLDRALQIMHDFAGLDKKDGRAKALSGAEQVHYDPALKKDAKL